MIAPAAVRNLDVSVTATAALQLVTTVQMKTGIYPNPVVKGQDAVVQLNSITGGSANLPVMSTMANIVQNQQLMVAPGANTKKLHTGNLAPGVYVVRITGNVDKAFTMKLVVC